MLWLRKQSVTARHESVAKCKTSLAVSTKKFPLCSPDEHMMASAIALLVFVRSSSAVEQNMLLSKLGVNIVSSSFTRESSPISFPAQ